jgi:chaperone required for assembly of F1-ATPase
MRDIFEDLFTNEPANPMEAARRAMRPAERPRFYKSVALKDDMDGFAVVLDDRPVRTPARRMLAAPARELGVALVAEWDAQRETIDPAAMPLTRLANAIIDQVSIAPGPVRAEIEKYLGTDLLLYRAPEPAELRARQAQLWDPVLAWAAEILGARFVPTLGIVHVPQSADTIAAASASLPDGSKREPRELWRLGAINVVTTLTGSALLAMALAAGRLDADAVWAATHVDEDWNMEFWGRDEFALQRRAFHFAELKAAATVLEVLRR